LTRVEISKSSKGKNLIRVLKKNLNAIES